MVEFGDQSTGTFLVGPLGDQTHPATRPVGRFIVLRPFGMPRRGKPMETDSQRNWARVQHAEKGISMGEHKSGPQEAVEGVVEGIKGKAKEVGGALAGRDDLVREGEAQQDKADSQRNAAKKEAEAESARAGAKAAEERQKANQ